MSSNATQKSGDANAVAGQSFAGMTLVGKIMHVGKVIVFLLSFGFAFPNVLSD